ncbi:MAG: phosphate/phosphite/phosphonate ABC transporter substrate-binding protein [Actinomycetota bacterium]
MVAGMVGRRRVLATVAAFAAAAALPLRPGRARAGEALSIGLAPYFSTQMLFEQYEPLRLFLERRLDRPVYLNTAKDFRTFALRTREHAYPFVFDVPHLGRLAQVDDGYRPLLHMNARLRGIFLVADESKVASPADLRGRTVATPDRLAIITMMGEEALAKAGLVVGTDVHLVPKPTHNAAVLSVLGGESDAALVWHSTLASMAPETTGRLRPVGETAELPTFIQFLAAPAVPAAEVEAVRAAVLAFGATDEGRAFASGTGYGELVPVRPADLAVLDRYLPMVRRAIKGP